MARGDRFISYHSYKSIVEGLQHLRDHSRSYCVISGGTYNVGDLWERANGHVEFHISRRRGMWHLVTIRGELERIDHNQTQVTVETILYGRVFWSLAILAIIGLFVVALFFERYYGLYVFVCIAGFGMHIFETFIGSGYLLKKFGRIVE